MMDVQAFLQANQTGLQLSNQRGPKSTHVSRERQLWCGQVSKFSLQWGGNWWRWDQQKQDVNGQGAGCQMTLPKQQHTQLWYHAWTTDPAEKPHSENEMVPLEEMSFH